MNEFFYVETAKWKHNNRIKHEKWPNKNETRREKRTFEFTYNLQICRILATTLNGSKEHSNRIKQQMF